MPGRIQGAFWKLPGALQRSQKVSERRSREARGGPKGLKKEVQGGLRGPRGTRSEPRRHQEVLKGAQVENKENQRGAQKLSGQKTMKI